MAVIDVVKSFFSDYEEDDESIIEDGDDYDEESTVYQANE